MAFVRFFQGRSQDQGKQGDFSIIGGLLMGLSIGFGKGCNAGASFLQSSAFASRLDLLGIHGLRGICRQPDHESKQEIRSEIKHKSPNEAIFR